MKLTESDIQPSKLAKEREAEYFAGHFAKKATIGPRLKPLAKACQDCAVVCDFYAFISDHLANQPEPVRTEASLRWFCHNNRMRACRGNLDRIAGRSALASHTGERDG